MDNDGIDNNFELQIIKLIRGGALLTRIFICDESNLQILNCILLFIVFQFATSLNTSVIQHDVSYAQGV